LIRPGSSNTLLGQTRLSAKPERPTHPRSRYNRGMSDEPNRSLGNWLIRLLAIFFTLAVLLSYQTVHEETDWYLWESGKQRAGHKIHGHIIPQWVEPIFWPARRFDRLIGRRQ
jgi:hypothetical protein